MQDEEKARPEIKEGDIVALTPAALKMGRLEAMTPRLLYHIGHENRFIVDKTFETEEDGLCLKLFPCCFRFVNDHQTKQFRCKGHPAIYFDKVGTVRTPQKGDKSSSLVLPILGEIFRFDYKEDENAPKFSADLPVLGKGVVTGFLAKFVKQLAEEGKIL